VAGPDRGRARSSHGRAAAPLTWRQRGPVRIPVRMDADTAQRAVGAPGVPPVAHVTSGPRSCRTPCSLRYKVMLHTNVLAGASARRSTATGLVVDRPALGTEPAVALLLGLVAVGRALRGQSDGLTALRSMLAERKLASRHLVALLVVALRGPLTVGDLAKSLGVARTTASLLVADLATAGVVERHPDSADRRRTVVSIAADHRADVARVLRDRLEPLRRTVARLGPEAITTVVNGLGVLADELGARPGSPPS
jgi:DNA-binding MarR family transcriptional regulator